MARSKKFNFKLALYFLVPFAVILSIKLILGFSKNTKNSYQKVATASQNSKGIIPDKIDYIFDVKPILSDRCYLCHGPDEGTREAGLRLDLKESAYAAIGENLDRHAIVPGNVEASQLTFRINHPSDEKRMPPIHSNLTLSDYEKKVLTKWIEQGAEWKDHWAFIPPSKPVVPTIQNENTANNTIDNFIISKLETKGLTLSDKASKEKLIRRVYFDLSGLPPSIEAIDRFTSNTDPNAYEQVVDELLNSTAYGERMTAEWLDIARYADTHGYQDDLERVMWPWRDWVIHAFNTNLPYDEFIKWQLAGDLLPDATKEQIIATGFNRNHKITQEGGVIDEEYRVEYVMDRTNTTAKALMGLTMECARCHDHKYDPISRKEFYGFYAFFNQLDEKGRIDYGEIPSPKIEISQSEIDDVLSFIKMPDSIQKVELMVMSESNDFKRDTRILDRGVYDNPIDKVDFATPEKLLPFTEKYKKNRLGLANWFFDDDNPLTSRVVVNRLWQQMYGVGLVSSTADFGNQGDLPSHPELLDWLSITFKEEGWNIKKMLKRMALSATYQQTSKITPKLQEVDPYNVYLARSSRDKLTAEMIRDNALFVSGLLTDKVGGPSVKPYQPPGLWAETTGGGGGSTASYTPSTGENLHRRSLYTFWKRTVPPPAMTTFDAASRDDCTVKRQKTSTPLQALIMLNDPQIQEASKALATELLSNESLTDKERITTIFRKITSRPPNNTELSNLVDFLQETESNFKTENANIKIYGLTVLTSLVFNLDEAIVKS